MSWASRSASSRYCVVRRTVVPSATSSRIISHNSFRLRRSRPVVGSSRNRTCGRWTRADLTSRHTGEATDQPKVLAPREVRVDCGVLPGEPDASSNRPRIADHVVPEHLRPSTVGGQDRGEDPHRGGLPGSVRAQQPEHRGGRHVEVDAVEGRDAPEALRESLDEDGVVTHGRVPFDAVMIGRGTLGYSQPLRCVKFFLYLNGWLTMVQEGRILEP